MTNWHCLYIKENIGCFVKSTTMKMVDKSLLQKEMVDKWSVKPVLADKMVDILLFVVDKEEITTENVVLQLGITATTAKRYLRQLTDWGYLKAKGGNKNRTYIKNF